MAGQEQISMCREYSASQVDDKDIVAKQQVGSLKYGSCPATCCDASMIIFDSYVTSDAS